jgi:hypothetical protein
MEPIRLAALAAALIICSHSGVSAQAPAPTPAERQPLSQAQTERKPGAASERKPAAASQNARKPQAQAKQAAQPRQPEPAGPSICVASLLGHTFHLKKIGMMVFGNALDEVATDAWGIDDAALRKAQEVLGKEYAVRRITVPGAALAAYEAPGRPFENNKNTELLKALRTAAAGKCDFYIVLSRGGAQFGSTNQTVVGLGLVSRATVVMDQVYLFASFFVQLYDGDSLNLIKQSKPSMHPLLVSAMVPPNLYAMYRAVDTNWWPASREAAVQSTQLKNATRTLVEDGLAKELPEMFKAGPPEAMQPSEKKESW